eukprot:Lithocolla_globosa_v1_NODE_3897_length_1555_cov_19.444000.p1 type:complete len:275 gc:universal NODE_3897_length_1555_cov_19.444000:1239-415(-)
MESKKLTKRKRSKEEEDKEVQIQIVHNFSSSELTCSVCLMGLTKQIFQCVLGPHYVCEECKPRVGNKCPVCTNRGFFKNREMQNALAIHHTPCPNLGCSELVFKWDQVFHQQHCHFRPFNCHQCSKLIRGGYVEHLKRNECNRKYQRANYFFPVGGGDLLVDKNQLFQFLFTTSPEGFPHVVVQRPNPVTRPYWKLNALNFKDSSRLCLAMGERGMYKIELKKGQEALIPMLWVKKETKQLPFVFEFESVSSSNLASTVQFFETSDDSDSESDF